MNVDFITAIKLFFANYVNFKGRSTRAEYWWAWLFCLLVSVILSALGVVGSVLSGVASLVFLLPSLAIATRRLHDTGRSGWWLVGYYAITWTIGIWLLVSMFMAIGSDGLIAMSTNNAAGINPALMLGWLKGALVPGLICVVLSIVYLIFMCQPSGPDNKYGPDPYGEENN